MTGQGQLAPIGVKGLDVKVLALNGKAFFPQLQQNPTVIKAAYVRDGGQVHMTAVGHAHVMGWGALFVFHTYPPSLGLIKNMRGGLELFSNNLVQIGGATL